MTDEQRKILSWVVEDADAWYNHALSEFGKEKADEFLAMKCARHAPNHDKATDKRSRVERDSTANKPGI